MNGIIKILLMVSLITLLSIAGFSLYKIYIGKKDSDIKPPVTTNIITQPPIADSEIPTILPKPTDIQTTEFNTIPTPTTKVNVFSPTPTIRLVTATPSPMKLAVSPTTKPTNTPTPTLKPKISSTPIPTEKENELPVAGVSFPTIILILTGLFFLLPYFAVRKS